MPPSSVEVRDNFQAVIWETELRSSGLVTNALIPLSYHARQSTGILNWEQFDSKANK